MLILKRKCLVRASRVRCRESGTPSTIIYTRLDSGRYELGCDAPMVPCLTRSRPNWITGPAPKSGSAGKSESLVVVSVHAPRSSRWLTPVGGAHAM